MRSSNLLCCGVAAVLLTVIVGCEAETSPEFSVTVAGDGLKSLSDGSMIMRGIYRGDLDQGYVLVVICEHDGKFYSPRDVAEVDTSTKTWIQHDIRAPDSGQWKLHVCRMIESDFTSIANLADGTNQADLPELHKLETLSKFIRRTDKPDLQAPTTSIATNSPATRIEPRHTKRPDPELNPLPPQNAATEEPPLTNPNQLPGDDHELIRFDQSLDILGIRHRFGVFRNLDTRDVQWIEERSR